MNSEKVFEGSWGEGYIIQETRRITLADITQENGWFQENRHEIDKLDVGEIANCSDFSGALLVTRIS